MSRFMYRSSRLEVFCKKVFFEISQNSQEVFFEISQNSQETPVPFLSLF